MTLPGYCPECGVSRIPPFLTRCSRCCDTELKKAEQALACELNKAFYGDDVMENRGEFWLRLHAFAAQIFICFVGLGVMAVIGLVSGVLTVAKFSAAWAILFGY